MSFDLAKFIGSTLAEKSRQAETNVKIHQAPNKKTGSYVTRVGMNNGRSVTRIDTPSGCVLGRACYIDMSRPYAEIKQQIKEAYRNGATQQELADATGYSQSKISRIINKK